jgi:hypothetical protein
MTGGVTARTLPYAGDPPPALAAEAEFRGHAVRCVQPTGVLSGDAASINGCS